MSSQSPFGVGWSQHVSLVHEDGGEAGTGSPFSQPSPGWASPRAQAATAGAASECPQVLGGAFSRSLL